MNTNEKYPMLHCLFGAYFHQDWNLDYESPEALISSFAQAGDKKDIQLTINELKTLLEESRTLEEWEEIIHDDFGCAYSLSARNIEPTDWLKKIMKQLEDELSLAKDN